MGQGQGALVGCPFFQPAEERLSLFADFPMSLLSPFDGPKAPDHWFFLNFEPNLEL
jgi:hypothetical protein